MSLEQELIQSIVSSLEEKKAEDILIIDIADICSFANYFVIANGLNTNQIQSMADEIENNLKPLYSGEHAIEGYRNANWILLDYGDIIIHLFNRESRDFYKLEKNWKDGKEISMEEFNK